jgi:hypothetical protein
MVSIFYRPVDEKSPITLCSHNPSFSIYCLFYPLISSTTWLNFVVLGCPVGVFLSSFNSMTFLISLFCYTLLCGQIIVIISLLTTHYFFAIWFAFTYLSWALKWSVQVFQLEFCVHFSCPPCMLDLLPISSSWIWLPWIDLAKSTNYGAHQCAVFSILCLASCNYSINAKKVSSLDFGQGTYWGFFPFTLPHLHQLIINNFDVSHLALVSCQLCYINLLNNSNISVHTSNCIVSISQAFLVVQMLFSCFVTVANSYVCDIIILIE